MKPRGGALHRTDTGVSRVQVPLTAKRMEPSQTSREPGAPLAAEESIISWSYVERLNMSYGLIYGLCVHAASRNVNYAFSAMAPQLLKRWQVIALPSLHLPGCVIRWVTQTNPTRVEPECSDALCIVFSSCST